MKIENDLYALYFNKVNITGIANNNSLQIPENYQLSQNYPNPFNPVTTVEYAIPVASEVTVEIYNILGQRVKLLVNGKKQAGYHKINWNASSFSSGVYFVRIQCQRSGDGIVFSDYKKVILLK